MTTIRTAAHEAHLDLLSGYGVLALPMPHTDVPDPLLGPQTLHTADWDAMLRTLDALGWEPLPDEETGWFREEPHSESGREILVLACRQSTRNNPGPAA